MNLEFSFSVFSEDLEYVLEDEYDLRARDYCCSSWLLRGIEGPIDIETRC